MDSRMMDRYPGRTKAFLILFLTWAALYLPALGEPTLRIEEGMRALPAVSMLKSGEWLVPHIAGESYYRKPPLVNWLAAASFAATGERSRQSARLPSVLFVLAFVVLLVWLPGHWPGVGARLIAAVIFLTSFYMIKKGRRLQIESFYIPLTAMAVVSWLHLWANYFDPGCGGEEGEEPPSGRRSWRAGRTWALWLLPSAFLLLGMLTKGPPLLLFYYAIVLSVLAYSHRLRALLSVPHILALVLVLGVPSAWAALAWRHALEEHTAAGLFAEMGARLTSWTFDGPHWVLHLVESLGNLLPWGLLIPLLWWHGFTASVPPSRRALFKGARLGLVIPFVAITLIPGNNPRYGAPCLGLMSLLLGWILSCQQQLPEGGRLWRGALLGGYVLASLATAAGFFTVHRTLGALLVLGGAACLTVLLLRRGRAFDRPVPLTLLSASLAAVLMLQYALLRPSLSNQEDSDGRFAAERVNSLVPARATIYTLPAPEATLLFFIREPLEYLRQPAQIDEGVRFLLLREEIYLQLAPGPLLAQRQPRTLCRFSGPRSNFRLLELHTNDDPGPPVHLTPITHLTAPAR